MPKIADLPFTIAALRRAYADGLDPREVVREMLRRLAAADDPGIFIAVAGEADLVAAAAALGPYDAERPLWGVPVAIKDNIDVAGLPTTAACPAYAYAPDEDAKAVEALRAAGALIVGKTNLDQFATGLVGVRTPYPAPRNPIDPRLVPGGSSSGSAVAVARGIVALALGTDTAGSGRVPAAFNNIVGLKPSRGTVSTRGVVPACRSLDCVSVFALTVDDAWTAYEAVARYDPGDPFSRQSPAPRVGRAPPLLRVGIPRQEDRVTADEGSEIAYKVALAALERLGAEMVPIDFSDFYDVGTLLYGGPWLAERYAAARSVIEQNPDALLPVTRDIIGRARNLSGADVFDGIYRLHSLARGIDAVWADIDLICVPSVPSPCTVEEVAADPFGANARLGAYTNFVNLLDFCALAVPTGGRPDGGPAGVTLIGRHGADGQLAAVGHRLHQETASRLGATDWPVPRNGWPTEDALDGIPVMVLGAHLSGLALNGELTHGGGVFGSVVLTAPDYRLYVIDGRIKRPGLLRVGPDRGASIVGEIWHLPPEGFGRLVAGVVPPLSIGTIRLEDGRSVKGFLVEAEAVRSAPDITGFGGWRAYLKTRSKRALPVM